MIICKESRVRIKGDKAEVMAEVTCLLHSVYERLIETEGEEKATKELEVLFELARMSADEIKEAVAAEEQKVEMKLLEQEASQFLS